MPDLSVTSDVDVQNQTDQGNDQELNQRADKLKDQLCGVMGSSMSDDSSDSEGDTPGGDLPGNDRAPDFDKFNTNGNTDDLYGENDDDLYDDPDPDVYSDMEGWDPTGTKATLRPPASSANSA